MKPLLRRLNPELAKFLALGEAFLFYTSDAQAGTLNIQNYLKSACGGASGFSGIQNRPCDLRV
jgi:hypothetical protein